MVQYLPIDSPGSMGALRTITSAIWQKVVDDAQLHQNVQALFVTNNTGGAVAAGYVGVLDDGAVNSLIPGVASDTRRIVVVQDATIASLAAGNVQCMGRIDTVNVAGAVGLHQPIEMSGTPGRAREGSGASFGIALTAFAGPGNGTISALLLPSIMAGGSGFPTGLPSATHGPWPFHLTGTGTTTLVAAPAVGKSIFVTKVRVMQHNTTPSILTVNDATGPTITETYPVAGVIGTGVVDIFDPPWVVGDNEALAIQQSAAGDLYGSINGYVAATPS